MEEVDGTGEMGELSGAKALQRRAGREERCDDREAPAGNEVEAAVSPGRPSRSGEGEKEGPHASRPPERRAAFACGPSRA